MSGKTELRIFDDCPPQVVAESAIFQDVHPISAIDGTSTIIDFKINGSTNEYLDLNDTLLSMRIKVCKGDGTPFTKADAVRPVPSNYFLNALFSDVSLTLNDVQIEGGSSVYPYKATIESALNFDDDSKRIQLLPAGVSSEEAERARWVGDSKQFELVGALRLDFLQQPKYLIPDVSVGIRLTRSKDDFALALPNGTPDDGSHAFKILITQCILYVRRVRVHPSVELGHKAGLAKKNAIYPYTRTKVINYTIPKGTQSYFKENLFSTGLLPKFIVIAMVRTEAYTGALGHDAFNFHHFKLSQMALHRDGQMIPYKRPYTLHHKENLLTDAYVRSILQNTQILNTNSNNGIDMDDFSKNGYAFFTFNLTPDFDMNQVQQARDANLRLDMTFAETLKDAINVIAYGIFDAKIEITGKHQVITDAHS